MLTAVGLPLALAALLAVLSSAQPALPTTYGWVPFGLAVVLGAAELWPLRTAELRRGWDERTREDVLIAHARTAHEGVGEERRDAVTHRAETHGSPAVVAPLGYVLLVAYLLVAGRPAGIVVPRL